MDLHSFFAENSCSMQSKTSLRVVIVNSSTGKSYRPNNELKNTKKLLKAEGNCRTVILETLYNTVHTILKEGRA